MWLSENMKRTAPAVQADQAVVTITGGETAIYTDGEERNVDILSSPGIGWRPKCGDEILVIKDSGGRKNVFGKKQGALSERCLYIQTPEQYGLKTTEMYIYPETFL